LSASGKVLSQGSGVKLPSGLFVTSFHVIKGGTRFLLGKGDSLVQASIVATDAEKDLCLLDAPLAKTGTISLGKAASLKVGETVFAVGSPKGLELSLSNGIVSQLRGTSPPIIQTTAAISPGSSGGGLFDARARLVGITGYYMEAGQSLNFALPVEWLEQLKPGDSSAGDVRSTGEWLAGIAKFEKEKKWPELLEWAKGWVQASKENPLAWISLGYIFATQNRKEDAVEAYRQALKINPEDSFAWNGLGWVFGLLDRPQDAVQALRQGLKIYPDDSRCWTTLGYVYSHKMNLPELAAEAYQQALRIDPENSDIWRSLAFVYQILDRPMDSIEAYRKTLGIDPTNLLAWTGLGDAYMGLKRPEDAVNAYQQAVKTNPESDFAWNVLAVGFENQNRPNDAIDSYLQALRLNPKNSLAWMGLAKIHYSLGNHAAALQAVQELRKIDPISAGLIFNKILPR
jgi:tetratricopeptide (TPR) repeat protein